MSEAAKMEFKTELKQLLHLITHSLYSNKEIFLRELISNACDAINKIRFDSLSHQDVLEGDTDWRIHIRPDKDAGTLTISDNGIGLSRETAVENLGTIARSGTRAFLDSIKQREQKGPSPELIGQFGVGFYSSFVVADRVTVVSRMAGDPKDGVRWESDGQGEFTVEQVEKATRGTDVILHVKKEEQEFLDPRASRGEAGVPCPAAVRPGGGDRGGIAGEESLGPGPPAIGPPMRRGLDNRASVVCNGRCREDNHVAFLPDVSQWLWCLEKNVARRSLRRLQHVLTVGSTGQVPLWARSLSIGFRR